MLSEGRTLFFPPDYRVSLAMRDSFLMGVIELFLKGISKSGGKPINDLKEYNDLRDRKSVV